MKIHSSFLLFCITVLLFSACKSKEVVTNPKPKSEGELSKAELLDHIQENRFDFDYLVIRGKAVADKPEGGEQHFNYKISMARDSLLLLSVSLMGIEGMKLLVRPDSIFARLSLEHRAILSDFSYISTQTGLPLTFSMLQDLIIGNAVFLNDSLETDGKKEGEYKLLGTISGAKLGYRFDPQNFRMTFLEGNDQARNRKSSISFSDYNPTGNRTIPGSGKMLVEKPRKFSLNFEHAKVEVLQSPPDFSFQIPPSYDIEYAGDSK